MAKEQQRQLTELYVKRCRALVEENKNLTDAEKQEIGTLLAITSRVLRNCSASVIREAAMCVEVKSWMSQAEQVNYE